MKEISRNHKYGLSYRYEFGWHYKIFGPFATEEEAQEWLHTETYDFAERELMSKTALIKHVGKACFNRYQDWKAGFPNWY